MSIVGARPQFIKASPVSKALRKNHEEILVHTGQHYDDDMSRIFFEEMHIPMPDFNLGIGSGSHAVQTSGMMIGIEKLLFDIKPDVVLIYGDTNSTIAGALAAVKLHIPVAHVEACLRSGDMRMPEEVNRIVSDHISEFLFVPTETAMKIAKKEGLDNKAYNVGDVMYDALMEFLPISKKIDNQEILERSGVKKDASYALMTVHRADNTDNPENLKNIMEAVSESGIDIIFPVHPRTKKAMESYNIVCGDNVHLIDPVGYLEMLSLSSNSDMIITDSGGLQKEAFLLGKSCITLRNTTEWKETVDAGASVLAGSDKDIILKSIRNPPKPWDGKNGPYGDGNAASKIVNILADKLTK